MHRWHSTIQDANHTRAQAGIPKIRGSRGVREGASGRGWIRSKSQFPCDIPRRTGGEEVGCTE
eukprot:2552227-Rhodomonas_salina.1